MILVYRSRGVMSFFDIFAYIVVISRKTVESAKNTICDFCAQISKKYEFCDIFANTVVKSCKKVKSSKKTICDTCAQKSWSFCVLLHFRSYICNKPQKRSNQLRTRFVTLVHKTRGDMSFLTFLLIQL